MNTLTLSPETLVRPQQGRWLIHAAQAGPPFVCESPQLLAWISQFARPTDVNQAIALLGFGDQLVARNVVDHLRNLGVLIDIETANTSSPQQAVGRSSQLLSQLARQVYDLSADAQGLGEFAETGLREKGSGLESRLLALGAAVSGLRADLQTLREPHLLAQVEKLQLDVNASNLRLHLGCGPVHLPGFINIDIAPAPFAMNVLWGLPFDDGQVEVVYLSHLLEHLFYPVDVMNLLAEVHRVLKPGGTVRVVVPDIALCVQAYQRNDQAFFSARREHFAWWPTDATPLENFLTYAGVGAEPGFLFESHKYGYDFATLAKALVKTGFVNIEQSHFQGSRLAALQVEHLSEAASWRAGETYLSLFVEAQSA